MNAALFDDDVIVLSEIDCNLVVELYSWQAAIYLRGSQFVEIRRFLIIITNKTIRCS